MNTDITEPPEIDGKQMTLGELLLRLETGSLPVWVKIGSARHRITAESRDGICQGLLMALELRGDEL